jgi:diacylglycerol kinase (ATP)
MNNTSTRSLLFIINPASGDNNTNFRAEIEKYFVSLDYSLCFFELQKNMGSDRIKEKIKEVRPGAVVAVGGDGTIKLVAESLLNSNTPMGIVPAGSANGMAKELGIEIKTSTALDIICAGKTQSVSAIKINDQLCIHLSDIGINAWIVKKFGMGKRRGWWGYAKAGWQVIWKAPRMQISIKGNGEEIHRQAVMVVVANATKYGTGVIINPEGSLGDDVFELVIIKKLSLAEIVKMRVTHAPYDPSKTEVFKTRSVAIRSRHSVHFQVDGEYIGKTTSVEAEILPSVLNVFAPVKESTGN